MKSRDIFKYATHFGTLDSRKNFWAFTIHCVFYILPAIVLGNYTEVIVQRIRLDNDLGDNLLNYILLQTFINISTLYIILLFLNKYTSELQVTLAGGFFSVLYFGMQPGYIYMLIQYMNG
uniref:Uncharacterized protein n=1 Tax=viral metagenome TaxID=1070528 RepID=A0A6C0LMC0_9ZZZZ